MCRNPAFAIILLVLGVNLLLLPRASAGPPFLTDDPEPTDYQHWEAYLFTFGDRAADGSLIEGPALELDYGAFPDTQVSLTIPMATVDGSPPGTPLDGGAPGTSGLGDVLFGVKYRFVHETNGWPQISFYPAITLPTGNASRGLGNGQPWYDLPIWLQKSWGPWTTYGGGGPALNFAPGQRCYPFGGWLVQRSIGEHLSLGGEIYAQGQDTDNDRGYIALNFGGSYQLTEHFSLLGSAGHSVVGDQQTLWYFALGWTW
jgi:Putative MetA-pathway of phenol degradation